MFCVVILLLLTVLQYSQLALQDRILLGYDTFTYFYPNEQYAADALRSGSLPLWNPYLFTGVPFLANVQTAVFYPFNLLFLFFEVPRAYAYSAILHVFLAGLFAYAFAIVTLRLRPLSGLCVALVFAFSGFLGALAGHLNQLQASAWLPLLLLLVDIVYRRRSVRLALAGSLVVALQFLAGHMQEFYLSMAGAALFTLWLVARDLVSRDRASLDVVKRLLPLVIMVLAGMALTAVQFLPTLELTRESIRSGGMRYEEAAAFSLPPWLLLRSLLPAYGDPQPFSEWIGYAGVVPLALAVWAVVRRRHRHLVFFAALVLVALFFAFGQFNPLYPHVYPLVPGLNLFRVPARWLLLYTLSIAALSGVGLEALLVGIDPREKVKYLRKGAIALAVFLAVGAILVLAALTLNPMPPAELPSLPTAALLVAGLIAASVLLLLAHLRPRPLWPSLLLLCAAAELLLAGRGMDFNRVNLPEAFSTMRPAVAHLLADPGLFRTLAFSGGEFDPGDMPQLKMAVGSALSANGVYDYIVAAKHKETLTPNLPLLFRIPSLDGYDGGVLPLRRYVELKSLLPLARATAADGRLREQLNSVPDFSTLAWLNVKYVLADRVHDVWLDGVYYDLGLSQQLAPRQSISLPNRHTLQATTVGVVSHLSEGASIPAGSPVVELSVATASGVLTRTLYAGIDTSEGRYTTAAHAEARKARNWPGQPVGSDYFTTVRLPAPDYITQIDIRYIGPVGALVLKGISVVDERRQMSNVVPVDPNVALGHLGDVKIYENQRALERAFLVHDVAEVGKDAEALALLRQPGFDAANRAAVLRDEWRKATAQLGVALDSQGGKEAAVGDLVTIASYQPEHVSLKTQSASAAMLVLTDSYYPGWRVTVDGAPASLLRADYLFRGVLLPAGDHDVEFIYEPESLRLGAAISIIALLVVLGSAVRLRDSKSSRPAR